MQKEGKKSIRTKNILIRTQKQHEMQWRKHWPKKKKYTETENSTYKRYRRMPSEEEENVKDQTEYDIYFS